MAQSWSQYLPKCQVQLAKGKKRLNRQLLNSSYASGTFFLGLFDSIVFKHSLVIIPFGLPLTFCINHSTDLNSNNKSRAGVLIHSIDDLKASIRRDSNIPKSRICRILEAHKPKGHELYFSYISLTV